MAKTIVSRNTAEADAALRAAAANAPALSARGPDHLAERLLPASATIAGATKVRALQPLVRALFERVVPGAYWTELGRTKYMDALLERELAAGLEQLVLLGAGYDSRAHRFADALARARVFEVDLPEIVAAKQARVRKLFGRSPPHVAYVAADVARADLAARLAVAGFSTAKRSFVIACGLTPYLDGAGVDRLMRWFASEAAGGSAITFDYGLREWIDGDNSFYGALPVRRVVEKMKEPYRFGIPLGGAQAFLDGFGLELVEDLSFAEALDQQVPAAARDGRGWEFGRIAYARKR